MPSTGQKSRRRPPAGPLPRNLWRVSGERTAASRCSTGWRCAQRHHAVPVEGFADESSGLILLDLPDFDSTRAANRETVQRLVGMVDVLVWVLDPQKYADAAVHNDFLAPLASHGAVTLVVLNQIDRLPDADVQPVLESLQGILARDGLGKVQVLAASALTGAGVDNVRAAIRQVAAQRAGPVAAALRGRDSRRPRGCRMPRDRGGRRRQGRHRRRGWRRSWRSAANVPLVVDAVAASYRHRVHPAHRLAGDTVAGPFQARPAPAPEPAPRYQRRGEPDLAAARGCPGTGPD